MAVRSMDRSILNFPMDQATHNKIVSFIWGIADDVLRDLFRRGKYPDVILPMCVLRRLDAVLEPTKKATLETRKMLDDAGITEQTAALCSASGQAFYNTSKFTLRDLKSRGSQQLLLADFEDYLNGFSPNVQDILENFKFRNQLQTLSKSDSLGTLISKFLDPEIDLTPAGIDNHSMGTVFEELVRKFNEENNEEAGEHWTPRDAVRLMTNLVFRPIAKQLKSGTYLLYDCACGTGGILTEGEETLQSLASELGLQITAHLYGQEINPETYAICKADMLLKGEGENAENIIGGAEWSTLSHDAFPAICFDFMMANPPYGKSWKKDLETMGGKDGMRDPRFKVMHKGDEMSLVTRTSDGQMLFLANMVSKMQHDTPLGSRIAEVHNGSSLFTGDAGQGESNIRRWIIENDWLEAIVALPLNLFYNTGIATYIWVLSNRKPENRKGQVQLIDASQWFKPLRKNLGKKNCELAPDDIERITQAFLKFKETPESKFSRTKPSVTGKSSSSASCGSTASFPCRASSPCASHPATRKSARCSTTISAMTCSASSRKSPTAWKNASTNGVPMKTSPTTRKARKRRACPRKQNANSSIRKPGSATVASSKPPPASGSFEPRANGRWRGRLSTTTWTPSSPSVSGSNRSGAPS